MQMTGMLAAASIRISAPSKLLRTRNIGTLTAPEHPIGIVVQTRRNYQGMRTIQTPVLARQLSPAPGSHSDEWTWPHVRSMSALFPKADICAAPNRRYSITSSAVVRSDGATV